MGVLDYRDRIKAMVEQKPVQPTALAKELSTDSVLASAMLAEMTSKGLLKVSALKAGSSPLYYHPDHPEHLLEYIDRLNEKDQRTVALLREKGVLRDQDQDPLTRVSLRNTKDFAKPLDVSIDNNQELFWKFYLLSDEEASQQIKKLLQPIVPAKPVKIAKPHKPRAKKKITTDQQKLEQPEAKAPEPQVAKPEPKVAAPEPQTQTKPEAKEEKPVKTTVSDPFLQQLQTFFASNNIRIIEEVVLKKKSEYDFIVKLSSQVGELDYYCKAKKKKTISESDLSHAVVQGQLKKLPVLFLSPGSLTKSAQELLKELKGITVKKV